MVAAVVMIIVCLLSQGAMLWMLDRIGLHFCKLVQLKEEKIWRCDHSPFEVA